MYPECDCEVCSEIHQNCTTVEWVTKDSGERKQFSTGMVRDSGKYYDRYDLVDTDMLKRWAELMGRGAEKYGENNWRKATTEEELKRFKQSAFHHFMKWWREEDTQEDHAAAVFFNIGGAEMVKAKLGHLPVKGFAMDPGQ
jgi:hypothetical protein